MEGVNFGKEIESRGMIEELDMQTSDCPYKEKEKKIYGSNWGGLGIGWVEEKNVSLISPWKSSWLSHQMGARM